MANPQCDLRNTTPTKNEILEALARTRIPGEARQIIDVIIRQTWGYVDPKTGGRKKTDQISLSQFCEKTGMKKPTCVRAINKGIGMNIVIKKDNDKTTSYCINQDFMSWKPLSKRITLSRKITAIIKKDNESLSKKIPTKEKKETLTKEISPQGLTKDKETNNPSKGEKLIISALCLELKDLNHGFNPYAFIQRNIKAGIPYQVTTHVLEQMAKYKSTIRDAWAYAFDLLEKEFANFNYAEELKRHYGLKELPVSGFFKAIENYAATNEKDA